MAGYTPLFSSIVRSSIWDEDAKTCKVWVTMLALADADGIVEGSLPGLAHECRVTRNECATALRILEAPDPDSRTPDNEGRRIKAVEGGWLVLNHAKYRKQARKRAEYYRRWRENEKKTPPDPLKEETNSNSNLNRRNTAQHARNTNSVEYGCATQRNSCTQTYSIEQVKDACNLLGIPEQHAQSYFDQYDSQGWKKGNNQPITELRGHMKKRWTGKGWDFDEKKGKSKTSDDALEQLRKEGRLP